MNFTLEQLSKDISKIDQTDILSEWRWLMPDIKSVLMRLPPIGFGGGLVKQYF